MQSFFNKIKQHCTFRKKTDSKDDNNRLSSQQEQNLTEQLHRARFLKERIQAYHQADEKKAFEKFSATVRKPKEPARFFMHRKACAAVTIALLGIALSAFIYFRANHTDTVYLTAGPNDRYESVLPDGSKVILGKGSSLRYTQKSFFSERKVTLRGEASFDVTKSKYNQFVVFAGDAEVRVYGTRFIVRACESDPYISATLLSGSVSFVMPANDQEIFLKPLQEISFDPATGQYTLTTDLRADEATQWIDNEIVFNNRSFRYITSVLSREFDCQFVFDNPSLAEIRFSAEFSTGQGLEQILDMLKMTGKFDYKKTENQIHLCSTTK